MAKHINTFQGGLDLDTNVNSYDNTHYPYALDMRLISDTSGESGTLTNMEDSKVIVNVESGYTIVGLGSLRENTIIFTRANTGTTGRIFSIANSTLLGGTTTTLNAASAVVSKAFNFGTDIQIVGRYETPSVQKIYWADSNTNNSIRFANLEDTDITTKDVKEFDVVQEVELASPALEAIINGTLKTGVYQYSYCLFNDNGAETGYSSATPPIPISSSSLTETNSGNFTGSNLGETTSKGISITITGVDTNFSKIRVARLFYSTQEGTPEVEIVYEGDTASTLTISDGGGVTLGSLILEDVRYIPNIFSAKTLEVKNDFLFAGNIVEDKFDIDFDARAYRFRKNDAGFVTATVWGTAPTITGGTVGAALWPAVEDKILINTSTWEVPENYNCINPYNFLDTLDSNDLNYKFNSTGATLGGEGKYIQYEFGVVRTRPIDDAPSSATPLKTFTTGYDDLSNPITIHNQLGYQRGEIYRFGIVFYDKYGRQSYVKWIGDIRIIDDSDGSYYSLVNGSGEINDLPIRFRLKTAAVDYLGPKGIVGWQIVRAERTYADATVKDCGYISNLRDNANDSRVKFNNSLSVVDTQCTRAPYIFEYISPETVYNKNNNVNYDRLDLKKCANDSSWSKTWKLSGDITDKATPTIYRVQPDSTLNMYKIGISGTIEFRASKLQTNTNLGPLGANYQLHNIMMPIGDTASNANRCVHGSCLLLKLDSLPEYNNVGYYGRRRSYNLPYGGYSYDAIKSTVYYPCSPVFAVDSNIRTVWGGDCYIGIFEYMRGLCSTSDTVVKSPNPSTKLSNQVLYAPVETKINLMYTVNPRWSRLDSGVQASLGNREAFTGSYTYNAMWETSGVHEAGTPAEGDVNYYEQDYDLYTSNPVYNIMDKSKVFFVKPSDLDENNSVDTRIYRTSKKFNGEVSDTWTKFPINNQLDVDTKYGGITKLVNFKDKLFYFQPKGIGVIAVQEREVVSGQSGASTVLGVGGVMDRYDYITTDSGCNNINAIASSTVGLYYTDEYNKKLCRLGQNVEFLSDIKGIRSWADEKDFTTTSVLYNQNFNELWFYVEDETIIFNEYINAFVSFTGEGFNKYSKIGSKTFITTPTNTGKRLDEEDTRKNSTLRIYSNPNNLIVNRFDSLTFGLTSTGVFDTIKFSNRYQDSNTLDFTDNTRLRFRNYIINNLRDDTGKRLYDNHLKTELTFNTSSNETIKVFDIITNYTPINTR